MHAYLRMMTISLNLSSGLLRCHSTSANCFSGSAPGAHRQRVARVARARVARFHAKTKYSKGTFASHQYVHAHDLSRKQTTQV